MTDRPPLDNQSPSLFGQTPSQTIGPFFHYCLPWKGGADLVGQSELGARPELFAKEHDFLHRSAPTEAPAGEEIEIVGRVLDGRGDPVPDALLEIWQADATGDYAPSEPFPDPRFTGFGRAATGEDGAYRFRTILPGPVRAPDGGLQAPHIAVSVFGRGLLARLVTRIYFAGDPGNETDPILCLVPEARRDTLIAMPDGEGRWRFDIVLQGERETAFFAL